MTKADESLQRPSSTIQNVDLEEEEEERAGKEGDGDKAMKSS